MGGELSKDLFHGFFSRHDGEIKWAVPENFYGEGNNERAKGQKGTFGVFEVLSCGSDWRLRPERAQDRAASEGRGRTAEQNGKIEWNGALKLVINRDLKSTGDLLVSVHEDASMRTSNLASFPIKLKAPCAKYKSG